MSHCFSTVTTPSMSQLRSNAKKTPQRQHEDCMTKHNEIQMDKKLHSAKLRTENKKQNVFDSECRSDSSFTVQKDTEVIHREVKARTKINCYLKENQSEFSENTSIERSREETFRIRYTKGSHVMRPGKRVVRRRCRCASVQKDAEVTHRKVRRRNEDQLLLKGEPVRNLGNTSTQGFGEETLITHTRRGFALYVCNIDYTSKDGCTQTKLTPE